MSVILTLCVLCIVNRALGKTFGTCELVMELKSQGFPENQISDWVCLIEAESSRRTEVIGGPDDDRSYDYGLFQINDHYWCNARDSPGKGCHVRCADLLSDNITKAAKCAKLIYTKHGFHAWVGWKNDCEGRTLPQLKC